MYPYLEEEHEGLGDEGRFQYWKENTSGGGGMHGTRNSSHHEKSIKGVPSVVPRRETADRLAQRENVTRFTMDKCMAERKIKLTLFFTLSSSTHSYIHINQIQVGI